MNEINENIGAYKVTGTFDLIADNLEEDILCNDEDGDWLLGVDGDWITTNGERAFKQDFDEGKELSLFDDLIDPQEGHHLKSFRNAPYDNSKAIEMKQKYTEWLSKDDRISTDSVEVSFERID